VTVTTTPSTRSLPLWPLALVAALLPAVASLAAWALSTHAGLIPSCNPFIDGCVSISRAARHEWGNHVFRALVLPAATLQALVWLLQAQALHAAGGAAFVRVARALAVIGVVAGIALVLYGSFLGTEGPVYRGLRRYGTVVYFGGTCLAMLLTARALQRLHALGVLGLPRTHEHALVALLALVVLLGLTNALVGAFAGAALQDRVENITEWWGALGLTLAFVTLASLWRRQRLSARLDASFSATR
jgi:hypothetical protein